MTPDAQNNHELSRHGFRDTDQNTMSTTTRMHVIDLNLKNQDKGLQNTSFTSAGHSPNPIYEGVLKGGHFPARINPLNMVRVQQNIGNQISFSKYKQLKKYNDSLMKMQ